jgi:uncharacterized lipoprotein YmbA
MKHNRREMTSTPALRWLAGLLLLAGLAGCASNPEQPPLLLALPPAAASTSAAPASATAAAPPQAATARRLAVRRVVIPEYLVARRVRYRVDASTLAEWPRTFWAERIEIAVTREFAAALRDQLPGWTVCEGTCADQPAGLVLRLEISPLDYIRPARRLTARARAAISSAELQPRTLQAVDLPVELPNLADSPQAQAEAITELLRRLAQALGPALQAAPPPSAAR